MNNPYETLGIDPSATEAEIKAAYRKMSSKYHPDRNKDDDATQKFQAMKSAYEFLSDSELRKQYDEMVSEGNKSRINSSAINRIVYLYLQVLENEKFDLTYDYDKKIRRTVEQNKLKFLDQKKEIIKKIPRVEKVLNRSHGDQLREKVSQILKGFSDELDQINEEIDIVDSALDQLRNFSIEQIHEIGSRGESDLHRSLIADIQADDPFHTRWFYGGSN